MTVGSPVGPAAAAYSISTTNPVQLHLDLITEFEIVPALESHENNGQ